MHQINMNLFHIFCLICLGVSCVTCAPAQNKLSLFEAITQKCAEVRSDAKFKEQGLFNYCDDWDRISKVNSSTNKKDVLCLLYFNAFTQYCSHTKQLNTTVSISNAYALQTICDKLDVIPKQLESNNSLHKLIPTSEDCEKLCTSEEIFGLVEPICSISYYYNQKETISQENHLIKVTHKDQGNQDKSSAKIAKPNDQTPVSKTTEGQVKSHKDDDNIVGLKSAHIPDASNDPQETGSQAELKRKNKIAVAQQSAASKDNTGTNLVQGKNDINTKTPVYNPSNAVPSPVVDSKAEVKGKDQDLNTPNNNKVEVAKDASVAATIKNNSTPLKSDSAKANLSDTKTPSQSKPKSLEKTTSQIIYNVDPDKLGPQLDINNDNGELTSNNQDLPNEELESAEEVDELSNVNMVQNEKSSKPKQTVESESQPVNYNTEMDGDSYFFTYFMLLCVIFIVGYVCYHNKQKILALILEGRRGKRQYRGRRPNSANYHKLDSNLEEAISSSCNKNTNNVIY